MNSLVRQTILLLPLIFAFSISADAKTLRKYYLTQEFFAGDQALTACAKGYHMATLFEILEPSNLKYNTSLGFTTEDSGFGPPSRQGDLSNLGWIRTGGIPRNDTGTAGTDNCDGWTTTSGTGTAVGLQDDWSEANASPWSPWERAGNMLCTSSIRVWCVQN